MDDFITLSIEFLEDEKYILRTQKIDPKYNKLIHKEVHEMVSSILYGDLMNPDKKKKKWFCQGLLSEKNGKYSCFYYPETYAELKSIKRKQENQIDARKKMIHARIDIEAKKYLNSLPAHKADAQLDNGTNREVA